MQWTKQGKIFGPPGVHAQGPTALSRDGFLRIYFATRPQPNVSVPIYIDVDPDDPKKILATHNAPLLDLGGPGSFDEFGIIPADVIEHGDEVWLYYTGWSRSPSVSYILSIGLALSRDGGRTFKKAYPGPIVGRTKYEPFMAMAPCILREAGCWHMWYGSGIGFHEIEGKHEPHYIIKYATSTNGVDWDQPNVACLEPRSASESNTRPGVIKMNGAYHMWFTYRGARDFRGGKNSYRIGYARSKDLLHWDRDDDCAGITVSEEGWDSAMVTYPYVIRIKDRYLMFYNGNGFGASGFGYAAGK
jgi:predicted GH43/DUF377 family glycosyl hydrolase